MSGNRVVDGLLGTASVVGGFLLGGPATPWGALLINAGASLTLNAVLGPPKPNISGGRQEGIEGNLSSAVRPLPVVYGRARVGITPVDIRVDTASDNNKDLYIVGALCLGSSDGSGIESIDEIYFDDELAWSGGFPVTKYVGKIAVTTYLGSDAQTADATLLSKFGSAWASTSRGRGVAYVVVRLTYDPNLFPSIPSITASVGGVRLYDPRTDTWTAPGDEVNPALAVYDYLTSTRYGAGMPSAELDSASFIAMANYYDETVLVPGLGNVARFAARGWVDTSQPVRDNLTALLSSCRGSLLYLGGTVQLFTKRPTTASAYELTEEQVLGDWSFRLPGVGSAPTELEGRYPDAGALGRQLSARYPYKNTFDISGATNATPIVITTPIPHLYSEGERVAVTGVVGNTAANGTWTVGAVTQYTFVLTDSVGNGAYVSGGLVEQINAFTEEDAGYVSPMTVELPFTPHRGRAEQLLNVTLKELRKGITCAVTAKEAALALTPGDVVNVTHSLPGWTAKPFWVVAVGILPNGSVRLVLVEYDASAYSLALQAVPGTTPTTDLPNPFAAGAPTNLVLSSIQTNADSPTTGIFAQWTPPATDPFVVAYEVEARRTGSSVWDAFGTTPATAAPSFEVKPLTFGESWDVRVRSVNTLGITSAWLEASRTPQLPGASITLTATRFSSTGVEVDYSFDPESTAKLVEVYVYEDTASFAPALLQRNTGWVPLGTPIRVDAGVGVNRTGTIRIRASAGNYVAVLFAPLDALNRTGTEARVAVTQLPAAPSSIPAPPTAASNSSVTTASVTNSVTLPASLTNVAFLRTYRDGIPFGSDIPNASWSGSQVLAPVHTGLTPNTTYAWQYATVNSVGEASALTTSFDAATAAATVPTPSLTFLYYDTGTGEAVFSVSPGASGPTSPVWDVEITAVPGGSGGPYVTVVTSSATTVGVPAARDEFVDRNAWARVKGKASGWTDSAYSAPIEFTVPFGIGI